MNKTFFILLNVLLIPKLWGCDCDVPKEAIEYYTSKAVFTGEIVEKNIPGDSLNYSIKIKTHKVYKGDLPEQLSFSFEYQKYPNQDSCYWELFKDQKLLFYAYSWKGKLTFSLICSNTGFIDSLELGERQNLFMEKVKSFDPKKYTFDYNDGNFKVAKPKKNIDSILFNYYAKNYGEGFIKNRTDIVVDINENGDLISANLTTRGIFDRKNDQINDTILKLNKPENIQGKIPETEFDTDLLALIRSLKKWDITYLEKTNTAVKYRQYIQFYKEIDTIKVFY